MFIMSKSNVTRGSQSGKRMAQSSLELKLLISGPSIRQIKLNLKWEICQATLVKSKKKIYVELELSIINQLEQPVSLRRD